MFRSFLYNFSSISKLLIGLNNLDKKSANGIGILNAIKKQRPNPKKNKIQYKNFSFFPDLFFNKGKSNLMINTPIDMIIKLFTIQFNPLHYPKESYWLFLYFLLLLPLQYLLPALRIIPLSTVLLFCSNPLDHFHI